MVVKVSAASNAVSVSVFAAPRAVTVPGRRPGISLSRWDLHVVKWAHSGSRPVLDGDVRPGGSRTVMRARRGGAGRGFSGPSFPVLLPLRRRYGGRSGIRRSRSVLLCRRAFSPGLALGSTQRNPIRRLGQWRVIQRVILQLGASRTQQPRSSHGRSAPLILLGGRPTTKHA